MKLKAFRIKNFRSIIDTGFRDLSPDGITAIIGQNESGKSSILEAIHAFETGNITDDDLRASDKFPSVVCIFELEENENINDYLLEETIPKLPKKFHDCVNSLKGCLSLERVWNDLSDLENSELNLENASLKELFKPDESENKEADAGVTQETPEEELTEEALCDEIFSLLPKIVLFQDRSLLPPIIDISQIENKDTKAQGYYGAVNFLAITDLKIEDLKNHENRLQKNKIDSANENITSIFNTYWSQVLDKDVKDKISIQLDVLNHPTGSSKDGQPYLQFWIKDKNGNSKPYQRSKGVQWYLSFFLTLKAYSKNDSVILLIDEPGANLHAKAQEDIKKIFESERKNIQIIYATHSPYLLDQDHIYRILATERKWVNSETSGTETKVYNARELAQVSTDTIIPFYTIMGLRASDQSVIERDNNLLLEEISAFYYFKAFHKLLNKKSKINFLPANGASNVPKYANLLLGWGINYSVFLDDDTEGETVRTELIKNRVIDENKILKFVGAKGIEDLFSLEDFKKWVLENENILIPQGQKISEFLNGKYSKALLAQQFFIACNDDKIKPDSLSDESKNNFRTVLDAVRKSFSTSATDSGEQLAKAHKA